jgi:hypothetical protein
MPTGLARYWAGRRRARAHNPRRSRRRARNFSFGRRRRRRSNPMYMSARRRRHNPLLAVPMRDLLPLTAWAVAGMAGARILPQMLAPGYNTGITGYGLNAATSVALSWAGGKFAGARAAQGLLVGGLVGLAARVLSDFLGGSSVVGGALAGDLDFDLGFYIPNTFPLPTTGSGPYLLNPGVTGSPSVSGIQAAPSAAQLSAVTSGGSSHQTPERWSKGWAA